MGIKSLKISEKLTLGFFGTSVLLLGLSMVYLIRDYEIKNETDRVIQAISTEAKTATDMSESLHKIQDSAREILEINRSKEEGRYYTYKSKIQEELARLNRDILEGKTARIERSSTLTNLMREEGEGLTSEDKEIEDYNIEELQKQMVVYRDNIDLFLTYLQENKVTEANNIFETKIENQVASKLVPLVYQYQNDSLLIIKRANEAIDKKLENNLEVIRVYTILSVLFSLALYVYIYRSTYPPINQLQKAAIEVGKGKLDIKVYPKNPEDEFGILAKTFNSMLEGLQETTVSKSYLINIVDSMADSLIVVNAKGTIKKVNKATLELLGYNQKELVNNRIRNVLDEELDLNFNETMEIERFPFKCETKYITKTGKKIPVAFSMAAIVSQEGKVEGMVCVARDITNRQRSQKALQESEERYSLAAKAAQDGLWDYNLKNNELYLSPRWKSMLGYQEGEIGTKIEDWFELIDPDFIEKFKEEFYGYLKGIKSEFEISYRIKHKHGGYRWVVCKGTAVRDKNGRAYRIVGAQTDITDRKTTEETLRFQAFHDRLTGLPNRNYLFDRISKLITEAKETGKLFALVLVDIDRFKAIENSFGHFEADRILIEMGKRISSAIDIKNTVARLEGDSFAVILEELQYTSSAATIADLILQKVATPFEIESRQIYITVSMGIALSNRFYQGIDEIVSDANSALFHVKNSGKANYSIFDPEIHAKSLNFIETENQLREAIKRKQLRVYYQPIVEVQSEKIVSFEALIRWQHPTRGLISPKDFMEVANETRLILPIGWEVLRQVCSHMSQWQKEYPSSKIFASVNISKLQFAQIDFHNVVARILRETGLQPHRLQLEITENAIIEDIDRAKLVLQQLKDLGVRISMDDFGTGYSALSYLHNIPINNFKIDRSFFKNIDIDRQRFEVMKSIINLGLALEIDSVAEGVETRDELEKLRQLNCQYAQGYLFSRPIDPEQTETLIAEQYASLLSPRESLI